MSDDILHGSHHFSEIIERKFAHDKVMISLISELQHTIVSHFPLLESLMYGYNRAELT